MRKKFENLFLSRVFAFIDIKRLPEHEIFKNQILYGLELQPKEFKEEQNKGF